MHIGEVYVLIDTHGIGDWARYGDICVIENIGWTGESYAREIYARWQRTGSTTINSTGWYQHYTVSLDAYRKRKRALRWKIAMMLLRISYALEDWSKRRNKPRGVQYNREAKVR